jgi:hypothetical protein
VVRAARQRLRQAASFQPGGLPRDPADGRAADDRRAIWTEVAAEAGADAPTQDEVIRLLAQLHAGDLLQADLPPDVDELAERGSKQKRQKLLQSFINPMSIRIPLWDPDAFLNRTWPLVRPLFSPLGFCCGCWWCCRRSFSPACTGMS